MTLPSSPSAFLASTEASRRYELGEVIAAGGMGTVYRAHDKLGQRAVPYKRMSAPDVPRRARYSALFQREFDTLVHLAHPHIVEVYDCGFDPHGPARPRALGRGSRKEPSARAWRRTRCAWVCAPPPPARSVTGLSMEPPASNAQAPPTHAA